MSSRLDKKKLIVLSIVVIALSMFIIGCMLVFKECDRPDDWKKEIIVTDYGDRFEHFYRNVTSTFEIGDPNYEHRILFDNNEILFYFSDHEDVLIDYIYNEAIRVYRMHGNLIYRNSGEDNFRYLPLDPSEKELYPEYYQLMLRGNNDIIEMLLYSNDKYAQQIVLAYAQNDFSEADKHGIDITSDIAQYLQRICSVYVKEYNLSDTK